MKKFVSFIVTVCMVCSIVLQAVPVAKASEVISNVTEGWYWPIDSQYRSISSPYAQDRTGWQNPEYHQGIDIPAPEGSVDIYAARDGVVEYVAYESSMGNYVCIYHGKLSNGLEVYTTYMHMYDGSVNVSVGERVYGGKTKLGKVGTTGFVTGAHLHFHISKCDSSDWKPSPKHVTKEQLNANYIDCSPNYIRYIYDKGSDASTETVADPIKYYFSKCDEWYSYLDVEVVNKTTIKTLPCSKGTYEESKDVHICKVGEKYKVTAVIKNSVGNYWYRTEYDGKTGYIYSGDVKINEFLKSADVTGVSAPTSLNVGDRFSIKGHVSAEYTRLYQIGVTVKTMSGETVLQKYESPGAANDYQLLNSTIDYGITFNTLPEGRYEYQIYVGETNYYAEDGEFKSVVLWPPIYTCEFTVGNPPAKPVENEIKETEKAEDDYESPLMFLDVSTSSPYYDAIRYVTENGIFDGISKVKFDPEGKMTRAMIARVLYNIEGKPSVSLKSLFKDVGSDAWYANAVRWAASKNIVTGYGNMLFGPLDNITREQLLVILWRYDGSPKSSYKLTATDAGKVSSWAKKAMCWAVENNITDIDNKKTCKPKEIITRQQVAQIFMNYMTK